MKEPTHPDASRLLVPVAQAQSHSGCKGKQKNKSQSWRVELNTVPDWGQTDWMPVAGTGHVRLPGSFGSYAVYNSGST